MLENPAYWACSVDQECEPMSNETAKVEIGSVLEHVVRRRVILHAAPLLRVKKIFTYAYISIKKHFKFCIITSGVSLTFSNDVYILKKL